MTQGVNLQAIEYIKNHKQELIDQFTNDAICPPQPHPISVFMAGSPGAGKTEFSKNLIKKFGVQVVRIDADEIRDFIPHYDKRNSSAVQGASALGVEYF